MTTLLTCVIIHFLIPVVLIVWSGIYIIWEFVRSVNSQIPPHCGWVRHSEGGVLPSVSPLGAGDEFSSRRATWENTWAPGTEHMRMMFTAATMYLSTRLFLHSLWAVKYYSVMKIKWRCQQTNPEEKQGNDHHKIPGNVDLYWRRRLWLRRNSQWGLVLLRGWQCPMFWRGRLFTYFMILL